MVLAAASLDAFFLASADLLHLDDNAGGGGVDDDGGGSSGVCVKDDVGGICCGRDFRNVGNRFIFHAM